jgi:hypothetical protein
MEDGTVRQSGGHVKAARAVRRGFQRGLITEGSQEEAAKLLWEVASGAYRLRDYAGRS